MLALRLVAALLAAVVRGLVPKEGLLRGRVQVVLGDDGASAPPPEGAVQVVLGTSAVAGGGWGDGCHPSTALCLEWLSGIDWSDGKRFLDYGCGSGVLMLAARRLGCEDAVGVDVEEEALDAAAENARANGVDGGVAFVHGREVVPGCDAFDVVVANILVGQLSRPSMVATLALGCKPGGYLCLSGIRPDQRGVLDDVYAPYFDLVESAEMAPDDHGQEYWDTWVRMVLRRKQGDDRRELLDAISDAAVRG